MIQLQEEQMMPDQTAKAALMAMQFEGIPAEKLKEMVAYANKLRKNSPNMKPARMQRLVSTKFNVKLV